LEQDNLHIRMLAGEILSLKPKQNKQVETVEQIREQLDVAKAKLQRLEEQTDNWIAQEAAGARYNEEAAEPAGSGDMEADPPEGGQQAPAVALNPQQQQLAPVEVQAAIPRVDNPEPEIAGPDSGVSEPTLDISIGHLNYMKKVPQFQGKSGCGQSSRGWPE